MLSGPQNMPVFGDNQLTPSRSRRSPTTSRRSRPTRTRAAAARAARPGARGPGHLGGRHRRAHVDDPLDRSASRERACAVVDAAPRAHGDDRRPGRVPRGRPRGEQAATARRRSTASTIVHRRERFPVPRHRAERRAERGGRRLLRARVPRRGRLHRRATSCCPGSTTSTHDRQYTWFTPVLGVTLALSLLGFGVGAILWAKLLITEEETVQERHGGRVHRGATGRPPTRDHGHGSGDRPRPPLAAAARARAVAGWRSAGAADRPARRPDQEAEATGRRCSTPRWSKGVRHDDRRPAADPPGRHRAGGIETVFPATPDGLTTQVVADSACCWSGCARGQTGRVAARARRTSAGRTTCVLEDLHARRLPGLALRAADRPAAVPLPPVAVRPAARTRSRCSARPPGRCRNSPIDVDDEGYFVAKGDFNEPVGPGFWERGMSHDDTDDRDRQADPPPSRARPADWCRRAATRRPVPAAQR